MAIGPALRSTPSMPSCLPKDIIFSPAEMSPFTREGDGRGGSGPGFNKVNGIFDSAL